VIASSETREKAGETARSMATFTLAIDLREALRAPAMILLRLRCGGARRVRESGVGVTGRQEEVSRGASSLYSETVSSV
jgi:hypothetical protein